MMIEGPEKAEEWKGVEEENMEGDKQRLPQTQRGGIKEKAWEEADKERIY